VTTHHKGDIVEHRTNESVSTYTVDIEDGKVVYLDLSKPKFASHYISQFVSKAVYINPSQLFIVKKAN